MTSVLNPIVYDPRTVSHILGIPCECSDPVPQQAKDGEIVVYYGGWDLQQQRASTAGKQRMWQDQDWYEKYGWKADPGYYRLLLPVPHSNGQFWSEQLRQLAALGSAWQPAPVCVAATALLVHLTETGNDLLTSDWCRCAEPLPDEYRVVLAVIRGRVSVGYGWDDRRYDSLWLSSACRKS